MFGFLGAWLDGCSSTKMSALVDSDGAMLWVCLSMSIPYSHPILTMNHQLIKLLPINHDGPSQILSTTAGEYEPTANRQLHEFSQEQVTSQDVTQV